MTKVAPMFPVHPLLEMDALPLEYKLNNRHPRGNLDIANETVDAAYASSHGIVIDVPFGPSDGQRGAHVSGEHGVNLIRKVMEVNAFRTGSRA